jgi:hypothetical protein
LHLGIELLTLAPLTLIAPAYVELFLSAGKHVISTSFGKDEYACSVVLAPHSRVAATGRKCLFLNHQRPASLHQAGPTEIVDVADFVSGREGFHLFISSSMSLTSAQLARDFYLNIVTKKGSEIITCDQKVIEHTGNGRLVIHMGSLVEKSCLNIADTTLTNN